MPDGRLHVKRGGGSVVDGEAGGGSEQFDPLIVAVGGAAAVFDDGECAGGETEGGDGGVDVSCVGNRRVDERATGGIDVGDFILKEEAGHVEVMDRHIEEDSAGGLDVVDRGWLVVVTGDAEQMRLAVRARRKRIEECTKVGIEATIETDLECYLVAVDGGEGGIDAGEVVVDRLFAKDVFAGGGGIGNERRVRVGGRGNQHRMYVVAFKEVVVIGGGDRRIDLVGESCGAGTVRIGDGYDAGGRDAVVEVLCVECADATCADDGKVEHV